MAADPVNDDIYRVALECDILFDSLSAISGTQAPEFQTSTSEEDGDHRRSSIESIRSDFEMWINYTGALAMVGRSLDDRLGTYSDIKEMIIELLEMLSWNLEHIYKNEIAQSDISNDSNLIRNLSLEERAWTAARQALNDLHFMASIIRKSSVQSEIYNLSSQVTRDDDLYFEEFAKLLVKRDYPNARRSLQEQLGSSIAIRRKRIYQKKLHEEKHRQRRQADQDNVRPPPRRGSTSPSHPSPSQADAKPKPLALQMLNKANKEHNNSVDTRSRFDGTAARERMKRSSFTSSSRGSTVRDSEIVYPEMPKISKSEERCECPYCAKPLLMSQLRKDPEHWKKHIDEDIKPYVCLSEDCTSPLLFFVHMDEWLRHMKTIHSNQWHRKIHMNSWYCETDHDRLDFDDYASFAGHMKDPDKHKRPPPTDLQLDALSRKNQQLFIREDEYCCPLCDCIPDSLKPIIQTGKFDHDEVRNSLWKHIAKHIKILAFISVPNWTDTSPSQIVSEDEFDQSGRQLRGENSAASNPSWVDWETNAVTLSFLDEPQQSFESISEHEVYIITDTRDSHWNDIGFDDYKLRHTSAELEGPGLSSLRLLNDTKARNPSTDSEASSVVNDFGDAKQLAETSRRRSSPFVSTTSTGQLTLPQAEFDFSKLPDYRDFTSMRRLLKKCMMDQAGTGSRNNLGFLPPALLTSLLPREAIEHELKEKCPRIDATTMTNIILGGLADNDDVSQSKNDKKSYLFVLAMLALLDKVSEIGRFVEDNNGGIWDGDLPLLIHNGSDGSIELRHRRNSQPIPCFQHWGDNYHALFDSFQWRLLVPTFALNEDKTIQHLDLDEKEILPWCEEKLQTHSVAMSGGYRSVKKVKIHPLCHEFHEHLKALNVSGGIFAIKTLRHKDVTMFQKEVKMLKKFNGLVHDHLVPLLGTYTQKKEFSMIFPSAECDVDTYWEDYNPMPNLDDIDFVRWVSKQCRGIMEAVKVIHNPPRHLTETELLGRHGDIKAENIFWFKSPQEAGRGIWVIGDLGFSAFNRDKSRSMVRNQSITWTSAYRPPECDLEGGVISRAFDIWTLGCFYLEMICWLLGGWKLKKEFDDARTTTYIHGGNIDIFFDLQRNGEDQSNKTFIALIKPQVAEMINNLHRHPNCTYYVHDLLNMIEDDMLIVISTDQPRGTSPALLQRLSDMNQRCNEEAMYCMAKLPDPYRLVRVPTGTRTRLAPGAEEMLRKNNMQDRLPTHRLEDGKRYHQSLSPEGFAKMNLNDQEEAGVRQNLN